MSDPIEQEQTTLLNYSDSPTPTTSALLPLAAEASEQENATCPQMRSLLSYSDLGTPTTSARTKNGLFPLAAEPRQPVNPHPSPPSSSSRPPEKIARLKLSKRRDPNPNPHPPFHSRSSTPLLYYPAPKNSYRPRYSSDPFQSKEPRDVFPRYKYPPTAPRAFYHQTSNPRQRPCLPNPNPPSVPFPSTSTLGLWLGTGPNAFVRELSVPRPRSAAPSPSRSMFVKVEELEWPLGPASPPPSPRPIIRCYVKEEELEEGVEWIDGYKVLQPPLPTKGKNRVRGKPTIKLELGSDGLEEEREIEWVPDRPGRRHMWSLDEAFEKYGIWGEPRTSLER